MLDGDGAKLAQAHFAAARAGKTLLAAWRVLPQPRDENTVIALCDCFAVCASALPPSAADTLATPCNLALVRDALEVAVLQGRRRLGVAALRMATGIVEAAGEPSTNGRRSAVQVRVREMRLMDAALSCIARFDGVEAMQMASATFLLAAVSGNVQNVVELGTARETQGLQLLLGCVGVREDGMLGLELVNDEAGSELPCVLVDLCCEISRVRANFETLLSLGLTSRLLFLLRVVSGSPLHAALALSLLERCVRAGGGEAALTDAYAVVTAMAACRGDAKAQTAGIQVLVALVESRQPGREHVCKVGAVQAVHFALTEHSRDGAVVAQACRFLLRLSPLHIVANGLLLPELRKVVRSRYRAHKDDAEAAAVLDDLAQALDLVSHKTVRVLEEALALSEPERAGTLAGGPKRLLSSRPPVSSSFRVSFHRKGKQGRGTGGGADLRPRRRVRSDFAAETTFERNRFEDIAHPAHESAQSFRLRGSRLREGSWLDSLAVGWPGEATEHSDGAHKRPDDRAAFDPLIETLARSRDQRFNLDELSSSHSSSHSAAGRIPPSKERLPNEMRLILPTLHGANKPPLIVVQREMRTAGSETPWQAGRNIKDEQPAEMSTLVEKRKGPIVRTQGIPDPVQVGRLSFDAVDSNSGRSEPDVGEEDSLFSFSDSEVDSIEDGTWATDEGYAAIYPDGVHDELIGHGFKDSERESSDEFEGSTISPQPPRDIDSTHNGVDNTGNGMPSAEMVDAREVFEADEQFPELDDGNTDSANSQQVVSLLTYSSNGNGFSDGGTDLIPQSQKYGERERVRTEGNRGSGNWGPPKESIWPLISIDNAVDSHPVLRTAPNPPVPARGESGSLIPRR